MAKRARPAGRSRWLRHARRLSQAAFLVLYLYLVLWTRQGVDDVSGHGLFFKLDPLAGLGATLAGRRWIPGMALGLLTVGLTLIAGRAWCGWICPLGTLLDLIPGRRTTSDLPRPWRSVKYAILSAVVVGGLVGSLTLMVLDPITLLTRAIASAILPLGDDLLHTVEMALIEIPPLQDPIIAFDTFVRSTVMPAQPDFVAANAAVAALLVAVLALNAIHKRFWCRYLCPLGGMLALVSRMSVFRQRVNGEACVQCGCCEAACPTGAIAAENGYQADTAECIACGECAIVCPTQAATYPVSPAFESQPFDPSRRQALTYFGAAVVSMGLLRVARAVRIPDRWLIRPPGATEASMQACIRCGQCLKVCPTGGLQPSLTTAGAEGLWTPVLVPREGYCNYGCASCGEACPTGAIPLLDLADKRQMSLGVAVVERARCLAWADDQQCIVCEELCPVPEKAIYLDDITVTDAEGHAMLVRRPVVDPHLCIGCGSCEWHCPVKGEAAIRVQYREPGVGAHARQRRRGGA